MNMCSICKKRIWFWDDAWSSNEGNIWYHSRCKSVLPSKYEELHTSEIAKKGNANE